MEELLNAAVNGIPIVALVMALTTALGRVGLEGRGQFAASFGIGAALGAGYALSTFPAPVPGEEVAYYFGVVVYALAMGLAPSGIFEVGKDLAGKAFRLG